MRHAKLRLLDLGRCDPDARKYGDQPNNQVRRDRLADELWAGEPPEAQRIVKSTAGGAALRRPINELDASS